MSKEYISGSCNIGESEVRQRQVVAVIGLLLSLAGAISLFAFEVSRLARLSLFFPLMIASIGWVQSRKRFCLAFGFIGTFNFGKLGQLSRVSDKNELRADRVTALTILLQALFYAALATWALFLLPVSIF